MARRTQERHQFPRCHAHLSFRIRTATRHPAPPENRNQHPRASLPASIQQTQFSVDSRWFSGEATLPIYATTELLGTKLRALYQRRKGRDLFDLWQANQAGVLDAPAVAEAFAHYMQAESHPVSSAEFSLNLAAKMKHAGFLSDTPPLLRPGIRYNPAEAHDWITQELIPQI